MRNVTRLKTQKDRLREDQAEQVRQALLPFLTIPILTTMPLAGSWSPFNASPPQPPEQRSRLL